MNYLIHLFAVFVYSALVYWLVGSVAKASILRLFTCVGLGVISAMIALGLEYGWNLLLGSFIASHRSLIFLESFIGVGFFEESSKWFCLLLVGLKWPSFERYSTGIMYACGIAAGFNLMEGMMYIFNDDSTANTVVRSFTAVPVHFLFGILMGFLFSRYKIEHKPWLIFSLLIPSILHGVYDFFIFQQYADLLMGGAILVFLGTLSLSVWVCRNAIRADRSRPAVEGQ